VSGSVKWVLAGSFSVLAGMSAVYLILTSACKISGFYLLLNNKNNRLCVIMIEVLAE
jgi:hypothetical protein